MGKSRRNELRKGVTYKVVHLPRTEEDGDGDEPRVQLVPESQIRSHAGGADDPSYGGGVEGWEGEWYDEEYDEEEYDDEEYDDEEFDEEDNEKAAEAKVADGSDEEPLFNDAVEGGVTDDFLRQLVLGGGDDEDEGMEDELVEGEDDLPVDAEVWRLLSEEEREGVLAARRNGLRRPMAHHDPTNLLEDPNGQSYPTHNTTQRSIDRQYAEMFKEFSTDARINEVMNYDPRTQGPLSVNKYLSALEEFVAERAGLDYETGELAKNKGLFQQLRLLAHREGAFDVDQDGGEYYPAVSSEKQTKFAESFLEETERIRRKAQQRANLDGNSHLDEEEAYHNDDDELREVRRVRDRRDQLDCETVLTTASTYHNQPNVIRPRKALPPRRKVEARVQSSDSDDEEEDASTGRKAPPIILERVKGETKEEKKLRRQLVKTAQRERRQEKKSLRDAYKSVESEEVKRSALSAADRRKLKL